MSETGDREALIRAIVDAAPPLTAEQREQLRPILAEWGRRMAAKAAEDSPSGETIMHTPRSTPCMPRTADMA